MYDNIAGNELTEDEEHRQRAADGTYERSNGNQLNVDAKIMTLEEGNRLLHAARMIKEKTRYVCNTVRVHQCETMPTWDQWSIQITNGAQHWYRELGMMPQQGKKLYLTPSHRPPSCKTNEMVFMTASRCVGYVTPKINAVIKLVIENGKPAVVLETTKSVRINELIAANCTIA